ncbi:MAG: phenylacetate--CoA ligase family protein [Adlercreutzia equolifaciens]
MSEAMDPIDVTKKGAALGAAEAGRFDALPIYKPEIECASREEIRALQLEKLKETVAYAYERVPYYRQKLDEMGVAPSRTSRRSRTCASSPSPTRPCCARTFPFRPVRGAAGRHPRAALLRRAPPESFRGGGLHRRRHGHVESECIARLVADGRRRARGHRPDGLRLRHVHRRLRLCTGGLQRLGCAMIPAGSGNTERHIQMIEDYGTTVLVATPSYAMHICEVGEKMGYDWERSPLRVGLFGGEPRSAGPDSRDRAAHAHRLHRQLRPHRGQRGRVRPASVWPSATSSTSPRITSCGR